MKNIAPFALIFTIACPAAPPSTPSTPSSSDAGAVATTTAPEARAPASAPEPASPVDTASVPPPASTGPGKNAERIDINTIDCGPPAKKDGLRVCGQTLHTRVGANGDLLGFAASKDGITLLGLQKVPSYKAEIVAFGAAGQGAIISQTESSADDGRFDVELSSTFPAVALCPGRVLATHDSCRLLNSHAGTIRLSLVSNGPSALTWWTVPENAQIPVRKNPPKSPPPPTSPTPLTPPTPTPTKP